MHNDLIHRLMALAALDRGDVDLAGQLQQQQQSAAMQPLMMENARLQNASGQDQLRSAPDMRRMAEYRAVGDLGQGLGMGAPSISPQIMERILSDMGLYTPDPNAALKAKYPGRSVEDLLKIQQMQQHGQ